jgi:hypothetical protein
MSAFPTGGTPTTAGAKFESKDLQDDKSDPESDALVGYAGINTICPRNSICYFPGMLVTCPLGWGYYCPAAPEKPAACKAGFYCPEPAVQIECPKGSFCTVGSVTTTDCWGVEIIGCTEPGISKPRGLRIVVAVLIIMLVIIVIGSCCIKRQLRMLQDSAAERFQNVWLPQLQSKKRRDRREGMKRVKAIIHTILTIHTMREGMKRVNGAEQAEQGKYEEMRATKVSANIMISGQPQGKAQWNKMGLYEQVDDAVQDDHPV